MPEQRADAEGDSVAAVLLTQVDCRSGLLHDMTARTRRAQPCGAVMIGDIPPSAGALPVDIPASQAECAVGCIEIDLHAGPGAPAVICLRPDLVEILAPALGGWRGHRSSFDCAPHDVPGQAKPRMRVGPPPGLRSAALDLWKVIGPKKLHRISIVLPEEFIAAGEARAPGLRLVSPWDTSLRGAPVSFAFDKGHAAMQALIRRR